MRNYEDLEVWRTAHSLTVEPYGLTENFQGSEVFGLTSHIRRAAASIGANLAEGCGRWGDAGFSRFVQIAMGSASELQKLLRLSRDPNLVSCTEYDSALGDVISVRPMLTALLKALRGARIQRSFSNRSGEERIAPA